MPESSSSELGETAERGLAGLSQTMADGGAARLPSISASPVYGIAMRRRRWYSREPFLMPWVDGLVRCLPTSMIMLLQSGTGHHFLGFPRRGFLPFRSTWLPNCWSPARAMVRIWGIASSAKLPFFTWLFRWRRKSVPQKGQSGIGHCVFLWCVRFTEAAAAPAEDSTEAEDESTRTGAWEGVPTFTADFLGGEGVFVLGHGGGGLFSSPEVSSDDPPSVLLGLYLLPSVDDEDDDSFLFRGDGLGTALPSLDFEEDGFSRSIWSTCWRITDALVISLILSNISWARSSPEYVHSCGKRSNKHT